MSTISLPKWPQMIVTGESVTREQASEIIRRTDNFFVWGGSHNFDAKAWTETVHKITRCPDLICDDIDDIRAGIAARQFWKTRWKYVNCEYIYNDWISTSFVGGPTGWCHPDGKIGFCYNIGKWPSIDDVCIDWKRIIEAFPYLDIKVTLMDRECCEDGAKPLAHISVNKSGVKVIPATTEEYMIEFHGSDKIESAFELYDHDIIRGVSAIDIETVNNWANQVTWEVTEAELIANSMSGAYAEDDYDTSYYDSLYSDCNSYLSSQLKDLNVSDNSISEIYKYAVDKHGRCNTLSIIQTCVELTKLIKTVVSG